MSRDSDGEEDYATYGTPLDPIEEDAVPSKRPVSIEDQVVRDKQGRRRFHGAFTGGFSAGYMNSVGSQEGWTPASFKSSRSEKAGQNFQKPEDFMDDEDKSEFGFAPKVLRATADYKQNSILKRPRVRPSDGPIPGQPALRDILQPVRETVGVRLLRRMGWRPGQGVGPRLSRSQKKKQQLEIRAASKKIYGCSALPSKVTAGGDSGGNTTDESDDEGLLDVTFAPDDYDAFLVKPKDDCFGIGYKGLDRQPVLSGHVDLFEPSFLGMQEKKKKVAIWGQAFGVGALEDDDEDIYAKDDMSRYDFALETSATLAQRKREERERDRRSRLALTASGESGGPLDGFVLGKKQISSRKKFFPPPTLPVNFKPGHVVRTRWSQESQDKKSDVESAKRKGLLRHDLRADVRASILDEPVSQPPPPPPQISASKPVLGLGSSSAFRPFASDPEKQARYEKFLELTNTGQKDKVATIQPPTMTDWDKDHERSEFEQAAHLYKPLTGIMNDRFVSASQSDDALNPLVPVERMKHGKEDQRNAAKMKMFGKLTRSRSQWQPCALLCKRFNVPQPTGLTEIPSSTRVPSCSRFSVFDFLDAAQHNHPSHEQNETQKLVKVEPVQELEVEEIQLVQNHEKAFEPEKKNVGIASTLARLLADDTGKEQPDPDEKPDLFKAIFLTSSDDSGSESESEKEESNEHNNTRGDEKTDTSSKPEQPKSGVSVLRNMSPPRGIFANLDLDSLNARQTVKSEPQSDENLQEQSITGIDREPSLSSEMMYGPRLPITPMKHVPVSTSSIPASGLPVSGQWVERSSVKYGKEKSDKHASSSSESEDSSDSTPSESELKHSSKLKKIKKSKKEKHRKHSKHKKDKKHKKHKSKSKHKKKSRD